MIKAVFFDIDGTLVSFKTHKIGASTKEAINQLRKNGIKVFIASGRHRLSMNNLENLEFDGYVCLNGAICIIDNKTVYKHSIKKESIKALLKYIDESEIFPCILVNEDRLSMNYTNEDTEDIFNLLNFPQPPLEDLQDTSEDPVFQVIAFFKEHQEERVMQHLPDCETTRWNPLFSDVVPAHSNKWIGISKVLEHFNISPHECMAFGDGGNDIEMISNAGIGIAMSNGNEKLKAVADYITGSVDESGVVDALKLYKLI